MGTKYRSWAELRQIVRAVIAETNPPPVASFNLSPSEEIYFRARTARLVDKMARTASTFKAYYDLPTERPFNYVIILVLIIIAFAIGGAIYVYLHVNDNPQLYPLLGALVAAVAAAIGWGVAGWIAHRNAVRQNTNNMIFARFSQSPFTDAIHRFHAHFGHTLDVKITMDDIYKLRKGDGDEKKIADSVFYLLNYFEFISGGVIRGDLDARVVRENIRGLLCFYYDKCEPIVRELNKSHPRVYEYARKLRTHYRDP